MAAFAIWKRIFSACRLPVKNYGSLLAIGRPFGEDDNVGHGAPVPRAWAVMLAVVAAAGDTAP